MPWGLAVKIAERLEKQGFLSPQFNPQSASSGELWGLLWGLFSQPAWRGF